MNKRCWANVGQNIVVHLIAASGALTALFMSATAGGLGPFAPLILALALYLMVFAVAIEGFYLVRRLIAWGVAKAYPDALKVAE